MTKTDNEAFFCAIRDGDVKGVRAMLSRDQSLVHQRTARGLTPLMLAVTSAERTPQLVQTIIEAGAEVNAKTDDGFTALHFMVDVNGPTATGPVPTQLARLLVDAGADVEASRGGGITPLMDAVVKGMPDELKALIDVGGDVNKRFPGPSYPAFLAGRTTLMAAVGYPKKVELLLHAGADASATDAHGQTALEYARQCLAEAKEDCTDPCEVESDRNDLHAIILTQLEESGCDLDEPIDESGITTRQMVEQDFGEVFLDEDVDFDYESQISQSIQLLKEATGLRQ
jgi:hypothetical protein